ncbi:MAG: S8 family peptidase [Lewinellaceae bacterium]|nr:S8 family peptidase [Lewinellaceae bacterium]
MRLFASFLLVLATFFPIQAQSDAKIAPQLWEKLQEEPTVECLIVMSTQADLSPADWMRTKQEKGDFVFNTLVNVAESTQEPVRALLRDAAAPMQSFWVINALWAKIDAGLALELAAMPEVDRLEFNPVWHMELLPADDIGASDRVMTPISWGLTKIKADQVWSMGYKGQGVVVGGQDTGYEWEHPAIKEKYRGWNGSTADHNYNWHDAIHSLINGGTNSCGLNLNHPCDDHNHGTHTVGTMTGGVNSDSIIGVAPDAVWMGCRDMEEGDGQPSTYIECFQWFIAPTNLANGSPDPAQAPDVINNSWGCPISEGCNSGNFATMETVVNNVQAAGILVVVSAGNSGPNCGTVNAPAAIFASSFSVGATNSNDNIAGFSSKGPVTVYTSVMKPDISAPGVSIVSCIGNSNNPNNYSYASWNGTSMAGPHVAGMAALIMSARPDLKGQVATLKDLIQSTAVELLPSTLCGTDTPTSTPNNTFGHGRIDALAAVTSALSLPVEFLSFKGVFEKNAVQLNWQTATENDCAYFEVQRSVDGISWKVLGKVACHGYSQQLQSYQFADTSPRNGINYYRLRQMDGAGTYAFSKVIAVEARGAGLVFQAIAQPAAGAVLLEIAGTPVDAQLKVQVYSSDGRLVLEANAADRALVPVNNLSAGVYVARLLDQDKQLLGVSRLVWW